MKKDLISKQQVIEILDATITQCEAALDYNVNDEIAHHELRAVHAVLRSLRQKVTQLRSMDREILVTRNTQLHIKFQ